MDPTNTHMDTDQSPYTLEFEKRPRFAYGRLTAASMSIENAERYMTEIADKYSRLRTSKLLIERRVEVRLSRVLAFYKVSLIIEIFPAGTMVAIVDPDQEARERFEWAIRRIDPDGGSIKVFATVKEAEAWLVSGCESGRSGRQSSADKW